MKIPEIRIRCAKEGPIAPHADYVLYWMTAYRRPYWNFSLQRAVGWAETLNKPLLILEALRSDYRWASDRIHAFLTQGMADNALLLKRNRVAYYPYVEPRRGAGRGLLKTLAARASVVVSDDFPGFFLPNMYRAAACQIPVRFELIDSNGLLPLRATDKVYVRAFDFRRFLQTCLPDHLDELPEADPLADRQLPSLARLDSSITNRWPATSLNHAGEAPVVLSQLPIDHSVLPSAMPGGAMAAERTLRDFLSHKLCHYAHRRNQPQENVSSGLSPYLHAGHISAHQVFAEVTACAGWSRARLASKAHGSAQDWWGAGESVESFLDELITWRELGLNMCWQRDDYDQYDSLPQWALATLSKHAADRREYVYSPAQLEHAETHDPLWNAAQNQLVRDGTIHNYLRMLWGKKVLQWSATPRDALSTLVELNNKYALDGRDPNSYSGIFWCLGRYDRAWGPERPIFGTVRYMSSENTARKVRVQRYLERYQS